MLGKYLIVFLFTFISIQAFGQTSFIGKWRRLTSNPSYQDTTYKQLEYRDLEFRSDSTFHIEGDSTTKNSTTPGWHVGDEYNGTFDLGDGDRLNLWMEPKKFKMFLWFKIIKLTGNELILRFGFDKDDNKQDIMYLRL